MLRIDATGLSVRELEEIVADRCSSFGTVKKVTVFAARSGSPVRPFALIYMETLEDARQLAAAFGRDSIGLVVIMPFETPTHSFPYHAGEQSRIRGNISASK